MQFNKNIFLYNAVAVRLTFQLVGLEKKNVFIAL